MSLLFPPNLFFRHSQNSASQQRGQRFKQRKTTGGERRKEVGRMKRESNNDRKMDSRLHMSISLGATSAFLAPSYLPYSYLRETSSREIKERDNSFLFSFSFPSSFLAERRPGRMRKKHASTSYYCTTEQYPCHRRKLSIFRIITTLRERSK